MLLNVVADEESERVRLLPSLLYKRKTSVRLKDVATSQKDLEGAESQIGSRNFRDASLVVIPSYGGINPLPPSVREPAPVLPDADAPAPSLRFPFGTRTGLGRIP